MKLLLNKDEMVFIIAKLHEENKNTPRETLAETCEALGAATVIGKILAELEKYD